MFLKLFGLLLTISFLLTQPGNAQVYFFKKYDAGSGLIQNTVKKILQDNSGRLWIGTAEGLSVYDGEEFINFSYEDGLTNLVINCFYEIDETIMLAGSNGGGVYVFQKSAYGRDSLVKIFNGKEYLINNNVNKILRDWDNNFWFCTDSGITKWSASEISSEKIEVTHFGKKEGFPGLLTEGSIDSNTKTLWFGTEKGLVRSDGKNFFHINELKDKWIYSIYHDSDSLIIGTSDEILVYKKGKVKNFNEFFGLKDLSTGEILKDSKGIFLFATSKGLLRAAGKNFALINKEHGLGDDFLFDVMEDKEGNIWVGSINGLYKYTEDSFNLLKGSEKVSRLKNLKFDKAGKLWVITYNGFFNVEDDMLIPSAYNSLFIDPDNTAFTSDLILTSHDDVWITTLKGIYHITPGWSGRKGKSKMQMKKFGEKELAPGFSYRVCLDQKDNLWVQNIDGKIFIISNGKMELISDDSNFRKANLPGDLVTFMFNDSQNNMWLGYFKYGLFRISYNTVHQWHDMTIKKFSSNDGLHDEAIRYIYEDNSNNIWVGTRFSGVFKYYDGKFTQYSTENGLNSNWVRTIIQDKNGIMWFGTAKGVIRFDGKNWKVYDESKGVEAGEIFCSAVSWNGTIYFGTPNGIYYQLPFYQHENISPEAFVKRFQFIDGNNAIQWMNRDFSNELLFNQKTGHSPLGQKIAPAFSHNQNSFVFEFTSTSLRNEEKTLYSFKLEGFDSEWYPLTKRNYISYINLPAGEYKFLVKAKNSDGLWSEKPAEINFTITPPFWDEWWFRLLAFVFIISTVAIVTTLINRYRMVQQLKVEKMRTKIATDLHDDIGTSLSGISIFSQLAKREVKGDTDKAEEYIDRIETTSRNLIDAMSDIVWSINPQNDSLEDAILKMEDFAVKLFEAKGIDVQISVSKEIGNINLPPDLRRNLLLIFKEMVANAAKHSGAFNVNVEIRIDRLDHHSKIIIIKVEDDGIGFDINKVYDGSGLKNLKARADSVNGEFSITSNKEMGTTYQFQMEIKN